MVCTWANEQSIRETYLKPFEMSVKEGGARAVMSSFNYIGYTYAGASSNLLQTVLRGEWGFKGFVLTDYFGGYGYQNADQEVRAGNDSMLATTKITNHITDKSATSVKAMRQAAHNILYTAANSWQYANGEPKVATPIWKTAMYVAWGVTAVLVIGFGDCGHQAVPEPQEGCRHGRVGCRTGCRRPGQCRVSCLISDN